MPSLIVWAALSVMTPLASTYSCEPEITPAADVVVNASTVAIVTHASAHFDQLRQTKPGVDRVVATMKSRGLPVIYLHDHGNPNNPPWNYIYDDWEPTAFVESGIGYFDLNMSSVRHVVCMGGFFWCCERNTVADAIRLWRRDAPDEDLQITQIVDGIFDVAEAAIPPYRDKIREFQAKVLWKQFPAASMTLQQILDLIDDDDLAVEFLSRQISAFPYDVNVTIDYFGHRVRIRDAAVNNEISPIIAAGNTLTKSTSATPLKPSQPTTSATKTTTRTRKKRIPELVLTYRMSHNFLPHTYHQRTGPRTRQSLSSVIDEFIRWPESLVQLSRTRWPHPRESSRQPNALTR